MSLTLKILSFNGQPYKVGSDVVIDEQGGTIGRAETNNLTLGDENKIISRRHATLEFANGQYMLTDCSLGGTFIDNMVEPVNNSSVQLVDGMQIKIGEYTIACNITDESTPLLSPREGNPFADEQINLQADEAELPGIAENEFNSPFNNNEESHDFSENLLPPSEMPYDGGLLSGLENNDLLNSSGAAYPEASDLDQNNLLGTPSNSQEQSSQGLMSENITSMNDSFEPAKPIEGNPIIGNSEIPEDFNFEDFFNMEENESESSVPDKILDINKPAQDAPQSPVLNQDISEPMAIEQGLPVSRQVPEVDLISAEIASPVITNEHVTNDHIKNEAVANKTDSVNNERLIQAFLRGVQMSAEEIEFSDPIEKMERIGKMLRQFAESTVAVLRSRAEFKSMFRVNVTTIQRMDNNPLKFAITTDDAIKHLINDEQVGFKESVESIDEGFNDLMNHQLAMQAGIQASLNDIIRQFDPATIEKQYAEGIVLQKKSKCWDKYGQIHKRMSDTAVDDFFGDAFSEAYDKQMKQLKK